MAHSYRRIASRLAVSALAALLLVLWPFRGETRSVTQDSLDTGALWLAPSAAESKARAELSRAVSNLAAGNSAAALPVFRAAVADPVLGGYAALFVARAQLALDRTSDALEASRQIVATHASGHLAEAARTLMADASEEAGDWPGVIAAMRQVVALRSTGAGWLRLARAAETAGQTAAAVEAYGRVHYEFPLAPEAADASQARLRLSATASQPTRETLPRDLARAERLYSGRRYTEARKAFESVRALSAGDERSLVDLRLAQCDFHLKRFTVARDALRLYLDRSSARPAEAQFYYLSSLREMGRHDEYVDLAREFVARYADLSLAETALNDLGTHYILENDDAKAAAVFAEQYQKFPTGAFADRAAWKAGWWAYKSGEFAEAIRLFESAATGLRRADYRPAWLYWAARAHLQLGHRDLALAAYQRVVADYRNSYYGREATAEAERVLTTLRPGQTGPVSPARRELPATIVPEAPPPNAVLVRNLLAAGMYDEAIGELRSARETRTTPLIEATIALALNRKGDLRPAITTMRRAYPQFMAEGGEALPVDILRVIFPVDYWDLIHRHASARRLDPFLMMALIAQESTFQADVRSVANAYGLMQVVPATGRRYAQTLGIRPFRTARLTEPETNVRIGMAYFSDLIRQFGDVAAALAAYNAGEHRVARWVAERPGASRDEFIDDIPFPETQNYVKRILGTAEDYRALYKGR
jgi:soluble lytic murein transglycosylase